MTSLEFQIDEDVMREDLRHHPAEAEASVVEETYFMMPVRLVVNGYSLLSQTGWIRLPIIGFSRSFREAVSRLRQGQATRCYVAGGGDLRMTLVGNDVRIESVQQSAQDGLVNIRDASQQFSRRVEEFVLERVPGMAAHREWSRWFTS